MFKNCKKACIYVASVIFQFHYQVNEESRNYLLKSFLLIEVKKYPLKQMVKDRQLIRNNKLKYIIDCKFMNGSVGKGNETQIVWEMVIKEVDKTKANECCK
ncbi:unnamed protein product [Rhizophagus irregularis]|nr:unnamed protein product [Rhizophagus irregularis]